MLDKIVGISDLASSPNGLDSFNQELRNGSKSKEKLLYKSTESQYFERAESKWSCLVEMGGGRTSKIIHFLKKAYKIRVSIYFFEKII